MKLRSTTLILFIALLGIIAYFFLIEEKGQKAKEEERKTSRRLVQYEPDSVSKFVFINPDSQRIEMERSGSDWKILSPVVSAGDGPNITALLGQIVPGHRLDEMKDVSDFAPYGLEKPFATVILFKPNGTALDTILVGDKSPASSSSYVRLGSSRTVILSNELTHNVMNKNLYHLRDKNFLNVSSESIADFTIRNGKSTIVLKREGDYWWFDTPRLRADRVVIEQYLTQLTGAIIRTFVQEDTKELARHGLAKPEREITLTRGPEIIQISFGKKEGDGIQAIRTGLDKVVILDGKLLDAFDWTKSNLRAMNIAFLDDEAVSRIKYETPDTSLTLKQTANTWHMTGTDTLVIKSYEVSGLLRRLASVKFENILTEPLPRADKRLEKYNLRLTLENTAGTVLDEIILAGSSKDYEIGASMSASAIGKVKAGTFTEIQSIFNRIGTKP